MGRTYDNSTRELRASATRATIVETAQGLLLDGGYAGMTVVSLAKSAGLSPQTVYNSVGGKAAVVKAVYDRMIAGDDAEVAMSDRPEFAALFAASDRPAFVRAYAKWVGLLTSRVGPLLGALTEHGVDVTIKDFIATIERERHLGTTHAMSGLRDRIGLPPGIVTAADFDRLVEAVWAVTAPESYDRLVRRSGWSLDQYESWLAGQLGAVIL